MSEREPRKPATSALALQWYRRRCQDLGHAHGQGEGELDCLLAAVALLRGGAGDTLQS